MQINPEEYTIIVEPTANCIQCETYGKVLGYRDPVNKDATVWKKLMYNELVHLSQARKSHSITGTIEFIFYKENPRHRKANYVQAVYDILPKKSETHQSRITVEGNLVDCPGEVITPTSYLTTVKLHVNIVISDIISC